MAPERAVAFVEALDLAERQADLLLELQAVSHPAVPERVITELPRVEVRRMTPFPTSGASHWHAGRWRIALNATEPLTRQRFSLAHEFKHVIDHPVAGTLYREFPASERAAMVERICDHFAGSLLMPRTWVESAFARGIRSPLELAQVFGVSASAMTVRLRQLGLSQPTLRCGTSPSQWPGSPRWQPSRAPGHRVVVATGSNERRSW
jgi:hypothetical protein